MILDLGVCNLYDVINRHMHIIRTHDYAQKLPSREKSTSLVRGGWGSWEFLSCHLGGPCHLIQFGVPKLTSLHFSLVHPGHM